MLGLRFRVPGFRGCGFGGLGFGASGSKGSKFTVQGPAVVSRAYGLGP